LLDGYKTSIHTHFYFSSQGSQGSSHNIECAGNRLF
jgi:hypothetical protein